MTRSILFTGSILFSMTLSAQQWCAPGAEWLFAFSSMQASGVRHAWYSGDTIVGGLPAQRIDQDIHAYQPIPPLGTPFYAPGPTLITAEVGDMVMIWDAGTSTYDTLMWFGAEPGDHWDAPHFPVPARFDVLDTGTTMIEGIPLRYLVVEEPIVMGIVDTLRERIGFDFFYINPNETFILDFTTIWLQCYQDDSIAQFDGSMQFHPCDPTLAITDLPGASGSVYPNPGTDHFALELARGNYVVELYDATGRLTLRQQLPGHGMVNTRALVPGLFTYRVLDHAGVIFGSGRWVKE